MILFFGTWIAGLITSAKIDPEGKIINALLRIFLPLIQKTHPNTTVLYLVLIAVAIAGIFRIFRNALEKIYSATIATVVSFFGFCSGYYILKNPGGAYFFIIGIYFIIEYYFFHD